MYVDFIQAAGDKKFFDLSTRKRCFPPALIGALKLPAPAEKAITSVGAKFRAAFFILWSPIGKHPVDRTTADPHAVLFVAEPRQLVRCEARIAGVLVAQPPPQRVVGLDRVPPAPLALEESPPCPRSEIAPEGVGSFPG